MIDNKLFKAFMLLLGIDIFIDCHEAMHHAPILSRDYLGLIIGTIMIIFSQWLFK